MNKLPISDINIYPTLLGGQSFAWEYIDGVYWGSLNNRIVKIEERTDGIYWQTFPENDDHEFISNYFQISKDYPSILSRISKDEHVRSGVKKFKGMRILKQDFIEAFFSFIASQNRSITLIRESMRLFRQTFGKPVNIEGKTFYLFPKVEDIANASIETLNKCKMGYRSKFIKEAAQYLLLTGLHLKIEKMTRAEAREELLKVNGIGKKVADCILIYGLGHEDLFPLDVWGNRIAENYYNLDPKLSYDEKLNWINNYFEGLSAYAGQYLFESIRGFGER